MKMEVRCSGLARRMVCAGFNVMEDLPDFPSGPEAEEGTAYGELVQRILAGGTPPLQANNGVYFSDEMYFYARSVVEEVNSDRESEVLCEQRIDWQSSSGVWIRGSYDRSFVRKKSLYIDDDKYGWGIVENNAKQPNWQLLGYAIGEVIRRGVAFPKIILRINQPRPHHEDGPLREWVLTYAELLAYKEQIDARFEQILAGQNDLTTGKQCRYCPAAAEACPAFNRLFYRGLEVTTEFVQDHIDETTLAAQLDQASRASEVIKIKLDSLTQLANQRMTQGKLIPGYMSEERHGDRKWKDFVTPDVIKQLTGKDVVERVLLSPAKAEKLGVPKEFVNQLVDRRFLGMRLVKKNASEAGNKIFGTEAPKL